MKTAIKKICLLLTFVMVFTALSSILTNASENEYTEITLKDDMSQLVCNGTVYTPFVFNPSYYFDLDPQSIYHYANQIKHSEYDNVYAFATEKNAKIIWIEFGDGYYKTFGTTAMRNELNDSFCKGTYEGLFLTTKSGKRIDMPLGAVSSLKKLYDNETKIAVSISQLKNLAHYKITAYDSTRTFSYKIGTVYRINNEKYYYVSYRDLGKEYFDEYKNFIYDSTKTIGAVVLDAKTLSIIKELAEKAEDYTVEHIYEATPEIETSVYNESEWVIDTEFENNLENEYDYYNDYSTLLFWVSYFLLGIALPVPIIIVSCLLAKKKRKVPQEKYWYSVSLSAGAWLFISLVLLAILLVI